MTNSPLQMRELEAKSIDSPASDGWSMDDSVTTRNATWEGGNGRGAEGGLPEGDRVRTREREGRHNEP